uniref:WAP domain-containing protein n=1 Tax=Haplochromis burtoni TaxID=8153 RepID=A0A3Q3BNV3_HAPBU
WFFWGGLRCAQFIICLITTLIPHSSSMSFFAFLLLSTPECSRHLNLALSRKGYEDCPRSHICCVYDGEEVCVPPAPIKPGVCPHRHLGHGRCLESCFNDRDCPFFEKCCSNGCGHECMAPYKGNRCTKQPRPFK